MEDKNRNGFTYSYSANEQEELKRIRAKYLPEEENKLDKIRRLDSRVTMKAQAISLALGVVGILILGFGMSLVMTDLYVTLGIVRGIAVALGLILGVIGTVLVALAYPVYTRVYNREKEKVSAQIISLTDELLK